MTTPQSQRDRTGENFARATYRLMKRCDQLSRRYGADFYVLVRRQHRHYDYCSTKDCHFPTRINMEMVYPRAIRRTPKDFSPETRESGTADD
ncbi:hypothetical protein BM221_008514 [Beauveria bassiana]|uniref:Uncharacterized protein n=1 Tax=Beauveria bassiana TaxID=176275 RepID=A0A2N6ND07_BEABA|nr:hypothetical protein BM221_008514 [Beauveria bassiana]